MKKLTTQKKKPEKNSKKPRINLDEAQKNNSAHNSNTVNDGDVRGNLESAQKARDLQLQKAEYETKIAELKLELVGSYHVKLVARPKNTPTQRSFMSE